MAGGIDWFRWHHGSVTDPKFQLVARKAGASLPDVLAVWAYLLEQASASDVRGEFGTVDCEALDCLFNFPDTETRTADMLNAMDVRGLIDLKAGRVLSWEKRQPKREREGDTSTGRVRAHRTKKRNETPGNANSDQETPRGEESREDTSTSLRSVEGASKRASRKCPASFQVTADLDAWAQENTPGLDTAVETEKFRDHTFKAAITDWDGAWRNWMRRASESLPRSRAGPAPRETEFQRTRRERAERFTGGLVSAKAPGQQQEVFDATP